MTTEIISSMSFSLPDGDLTGWCQEEEGWAYYNQSGHRAVDTWVQSADGSTAYYLDENGVMATDRLIALGDSVGYVDETGAQARDRWVAVDNQGLCGEPVDTVYYYVDTKGKAFRDMRRRINGKTYFFDSEGHRLSGWHEKEGELYYLGTEHEGWTHTGWQLLTSEEENGFEQWFYFHPKSGKAYRGKKKINDFYYYFDEDTAVMQEGWLEREDNLHAYYQPGTGKLITGWVYCEGPENGEEGWYYLDSNGIPFNQGAKDSASYVLGLGSYTATALGYIDLVFHNNIAAKTIHGDTYLFDENGKKLTGRFLMWEVKNKGGQDLAPFINGSSGYLYYFDDREGDGEGSGKMLKGRQRITECGTDYYCDFGTKGMAYTSYIVDGYLYDEEGVLVQAEYGDKYRILDLAEEQVTITEKGSSRKHENCLMIVDRKGKVKKNGIVTFNGYKYTVKDYEVAGTPEEVD